MCARNLCVAGFFRLRFRFFCDIALFDLALLGRNPPRVPPFRSPLLQKQIERQIENFVI